MRYFLLISILCLIFIGSCLNSVPTYDLSVERSVAQLDSDGSYHIETARIKNIWYIGVNNPALNMADICVEWKFATEKKRECIDNDGNSGSEVFSFPVLSEAENGASFRIVGSTQIDPRDITVYSIDTRTSGSRLAFVMPGTQAESGIISRAEWGADETMRYVDSSYWQSKYATILDYIQRPKTQNELDAIDLEDKKADYIIKNGGASTEMTSIKRTENGHELLWPIQKVKQISRIVIHHTAESMDTSKSDADLIRGIYAYHTLSRQWGDIGYNYLIGQRGLIYEGRAGGDYVVASHAAYNNMGSVGISVIGDYSRNSLNRDQIGGIEQAISMMASKYGITLSENKKGVRKCMIASCYLFEEVTTKSLIGHQDIGHTSCPGAGIYQYIPEWISRLDRVYSPVYNLEQGVIEPKVANRVMNTTLKNNTPRIVLIPTASASTTIASNVNIAIVRYIGPKFRVRLSYPNIENITLSAADTGIGKLILDNKKIPLKSLEKIQVGTVGNNQLRIKIGENIYTGGVLKLAHTAVRIDSWDRVPDWDKSGRYNDNTFRDTIRVINQDSKLILINDLPIEWYLKGMGEVSNSDLTEKIKTIVVSARSYARWYMDPKNRKFNTNLYDGSDDPDVFQKYLGYSYELRSPSVAQVVDSTSRQVITYSGSLIKPWYHSSSDGRTLSALQYCQQNGSSNCIDIPYLQSVFDPGSQGKTRAGHGVGISGIGATYWANEGWDYKKIIQYYLKGVEIQRK